MSLKTYRQQKKRVKEGMKKIMVKLNHRDLGKTVKSRISHEAN